MNKTKELLINKTENIKKNLVSYTMRVEEEKNVSYKRYVQNKKSRVENALIKGKNALSAARSDKNLKARLYILKKGSDELSDFLNHESKFDKDFVYLYNDLESYVKNISAKYAKTILPESVPLKNFENKNIENTAEKIISEMAELSKESCRKVIEDIFHEYKTKIPDLKTLDELKNLCIKIKTETDIIISEYNRNRIDGRFPEKINISVLTSDIQNKAVAMAEELSQKYELKAELASMKLKNKTTEFITTLKENINQIPSPSKISNFIRIFEDTSVEINSLIKESSTINREQLEKAREVSGKIETISDLLIEISTSIKNPDNFKKLNQKNTTITKLEKMNNQIKKILESYESAKEKIKKNITKKTWEIPAHLVSLISNNDFSDDDYRKEIEIVEKTFYVFEKYINKEDFYRELKNIKEKNTKDIDDSKLEKEYELNGLIIRNGNTESIDEEKKDIKSIFKKLLRIK